MYLGSTLDESLIVQEDESDTYNKVLTKYFTAEQQALINDSADCISVRPKLVFVNRRLGLYCH